VARYLSREWLADLHTAAVAHEGLRSAANDIELIVQHRITGAADGDVVFHIVLDHGNAAVVPGAADHPTVTFTEDRATAEAIARGELSAQAAFMAGRIQMSGDLARLVEHHHPLAAIDDVFRSVRSRTGFG
jgi:hypothetical protein